MNPLSLLIMLAIASSLDVAAQPVEKVRKDLACGPDYLVSNRENIYGASAEKAPFSGIVHIGKNNGDDWGTGAFISDSVLITARHVAKGLKNLELIRYTRTSIIDSFFTAKDFEVLYDDNNRWKINHDIALIKFKNKKKVKPLVGVIFNLQPYNHLQIEKNDTLHLTGFPFDKADINQYRKPFVVDTLTDKFTLVDSTQFNEDTTMIGYPLYSCNGDSGAPLWIKKNNKFYIVGIHYGYANHVVENDDYNLSTLINQRKIEWINQQLRPKKKQ